MKEYRCTRNAPYQETDCTGKHDLTARQGYYVEAKTPEEALNHMENTFVNDTCNGLINANRCFTVHFYKELA